MQTPIQLVSKLYFYCKHTNPIPVQCGHMLCSTVAQTIQTAGYQSVFLICSGTVYKKGMLDKLISDLKQYQISVTLHTGIPADPSIEDVEQGLSRLRKFHCDCVIAVGGGSVLDCAKVIALRAANPWYSVRAMGFYLRPLRRSLPLYVMPTTSGTGSEVTYFSVITDQNRQKKCAIVTDRYLPEKIFLDTELLRHVPRNTTIYAGLDALTHSIEAWISTAHRLFAADLETVPAVCRDIFTFLPIAAAEPDNLLAREKMALAAYHAGLHFRRTSVGFVHAIAHRLGELYHIPHGFACAVVLPYVLQASLPEIEPRLDLLAKKSGIAENAAAWITEIQAFSRQLGIPATISQLQRSDYPIIIRRSRAEAALQGCPVMFSGTQLTTILNQMLPKESEEFQ